MGPEGEGRGRVSEARDLAVQGLVKTISSQKFTEQEVLAGVMLVTGGGDVAVHAVQISLVDEGANTMHFPISFSVFAGFISYAAQSSLPLLPICILEVLEKDFSVMHGSTGVVSVRNGLFQAQHIAVRDFLPITRKCGSVCGRFWLGFPAFHLEPKRESSLC